MSKQELAATLLGSRAIPARWASTRLGGEGVRILAYHRICDADPATFPFDRDVISATTSQFREQMRFVSRCFDVVSFADLRRCDVEGRPWPRRGVLITFDDGYRDNHTHAFPVLREFGLPATIFLATGHVESPEPFWWDRVAWHLNRTPLKSVLFSQMSPDRIPLATPEQRRRAICRVLEWIKTVNEQVKSSFLAELAPALQMPADPVDPDLHLSWEQVREMAAYGIDFGAHTITHPVLTQVTPAQLEVELKESKAEIERRLGTQVIAFSYPVGPMGPPGGAVRRAVADCGFHYAVSYDQGLARQSCDPMALPRIAADLISLRMFRAKLTFPRLLLAAPAATARVADSDNQPIHV